MSTVIVSGATGFVGSHLVAELSRQGEYVIALCRPDSLHLHKIEGLSGVSTVMCSLSQIKQLPDMISNSVPVDTFYHMAWQGSSGPARSNPVLQTENVLYSLHAAIAAKELKCRRFVVAGSISEHAAVCAVQMDQFAQNSFYGLAKQQTKELLRAYSKEWQMECIWAQLSNLYGNGCNNGNLIDYTISQLKAGISPKFTRATQIYDFLHIDDCIKALLLLRTAPLSQRFYYVGSGAPQPLKEYLKVVGECFAPNIPLLFGARPDDAMTWKRDWFSIHALQSDTGYQADHNFGESIKWMKEHY